ncbi:FtsX-like permease family protein [Streptomyces neyagawaensis]|uniref:FtsX-like permease family protein n=1 Tax=Streptomyces neyagawaensis TaxID=42238 RepID=A0ABV3AWX3_9ACTN
MSALGKVVRAGVGRRRVQTVVMVLTTLMAVTASVLAAGLLVAARAPFERAFDERRGAHLVGQFDGARASVAEVKATAEAAGVAAAAGPFLSLSVRPRTASQSEFVPGWVDLPPLTVVGRADASGPVDRIQLVEGAWPSRAGQIAVDESEVPLRPGARLTIPDAPGSPTLTVVGVARSVTGTADAWVTPDQAKGLAGATDAAGTSRPASSPSSYSYEMYYRFHDARTAAEVAAGRAAVAGAVPEGVMTGARSYLAVKQEQTANAMAFVPFLVAFGGLGLFLSVLVIGIVVGGAVGAATRRIGVLKALGFTPGQVVRAYVAQAFVPAAVGCVLGVGLGNALAVPVLAEADDVVGAPTTTVPLWIDVAVPVGALVLVAGAALVPALRAGRLRTVEAITVGRTAGEAGRGAGRLGRLASRLAPRVPLPRAVGLGLAYPFARPGRSLVTAAAVGFGAVSVTFAVGLALTLGAVQEGRLLNSAADVVVEAGGGQGPPGADVVRAGGEEEGERADPGAVADALRAQEGTARFYGTAQAQVAASGVTGATTVVAYEGDSAWGAPQIVSGRWLDGAGEAVVTERFLDAAGIEVGDTVTLTDEGRRTTVRIVGAAFFTEGGSMALLTSTTTLADLGLGADARPGQFHVRTEPGTDPARYLDSLNGALKAAGVGAVARTGTPGTSGVIVAMDALIGMLTLMLVVVAGLGVLNTVVLDTRDRVRDLGVLKALGMTPRQTIAMVVTSVAGVGLLAGVVAVPVGVALHRAVTPLMGDAIGMSVPAADIAVYDPPVLVLLALGGLVLAVAGALLPAGWAARAGTATALRTE